MGPVIALSGLHGTGKSTYAKALAEEFHLKPISAGSVFRRLAQEAGLTLLEMTRRAEEDETIDRTVDGMMAKEAEKGGVVLEGQLSAWLVREKEHLAIFLTAPDNVRFQRIAARDSLRYEEAEKVTLERERAERRRFLKLYGFDVSDLSIYHIIVDTTLKPLDEMIITLKKIVGDYIRERPKR